MSHQVIWSKVIVEEFIIVGNLTKEEEHVLRTRVAGWTITKQAMELHMSRSKVNQIVKRLKKKYDVAQRFSTILPPRKENAVELYMDTH